LDVEIHTRGDVSISKVRLWNYNRSQQLEQGAKDLQIFIGDKLWWGGVLAKGSGKASAEDYMDVTPNTGLARQVETAAEPLPPEHDGRQPPGVGQHGVGARRELQEMAAEAAAAAVREYGGLELEPRVDEVHPDVHRPRRRRPDQQVRAEDSMPVSASVEFSDVAGASRPGTSVDDDDWDASPAPRESAPVSASIEFSNSAAPSAGLSGDRPGTSVDDDDWDAHDRSPALRGPASVSASIVFSNSAAPSASESANRPHTSVDDDESPPPRELTKPVHVRRGRRAYAQGAPHVAAATGEIADGREPVRVQAVPQV
jgi:hypothetical protein